MSRHPLQNPPAHVRLFNPIRPPSETVHRILKEVTHELVRSKVNVFAPLLDLLVAWQHQRPAGRNAIHAKICT